MIELDCSVIVPTYNREQLLDYTLASLTRQRLPRDRFEVLVVDDGSSDNSQAIVEQYQGLLNVRYYFQEDDGYRVALARNTGVRNARSPLCVFIDSGVILHSRCLEAHVRHHEDSSERRAAVGYVFCFNKDNEDAEQIRRELDLEDVDGSIDRFSASGRWLDFREEFYSKYGDEYDWLPAPYLIFWTCNLSVRTADLHAVGIFDESFRTWGIEDVDLGYRLFRDGVRLTLCREAQSLHYPHPKSYADNMKSVFPNALYMAGKYDTPITNLLPHHEFFIINDLVQKLNLPRCEEYLRAEGRDVLLNIRPK